MKLEASEENTLYVMTMVKYLSVLTIIDYKSINREFRVGIALNMDALFKEAVFYM